MVATGPMATNPPFVKERDPIGGAGGQREVVGDDDGGDLQLLL